MPPPHCAYHKWLCKFKNHSIKIRPKNTPILTHFTVLVFSKRCHEQCLLAALRILLSVLEYCHQAWLRWLGVEIMSFQGFPYPLNQTEVSRYQAKGRNLPQTFMSPRSRRLLYCCIRGRSLLLTFITSHFTQWSATPLFPQPEKLQDPTRNTGMLKSSLCSSVVSCFLSKPVSLNYIL